MGETGTCGGRRRTKKHARRRRHRTRRGGFAPASFSGAVAGMNGQPAGADFRAIGVSGAGPGYEASSYGQKGGRRSRRGRRGHRRSRRRMRGGDASAMGGLGKGGVSASFTGGDYLKTDSGADLTVRGFGGTSTRVQ